MGILRLLLAISVVIVHSGPVFGLRLVDGVTAVQGFFVISGFYMAMILNEKYPKTPQGTVLFYRNRFLRIYPLYWLVLATTIVVFCLALLLPGAHHNALATFFSNWQAVGPGALVFLISSNVMLLGLDWGLFFTYPLSNGTSVSAAAFQLVPQAWSLGIEVAVYAIAPWLFRRSLWPIVIVAVTSVVARAIGTYNGLSADPWDYRFFPFEVGLFCLGALAYRIAPKTFRQNSIAIFVSVSVLAVLLVGFPFLPDQPAPLAGFRIDQLTFLLALALCIAPLFELSRNAKWDRAIGDMSYPLYLCHLLVIQTLGAHVDPWNVLPLVISLALAWVLAKAVRPIEQMRQRRAARPTLLLSISREP